MAVSQNNDHKGMFNSRSQRKLSKYSKSIQVITIQRLDELLARPAGSENERDGAA